MAKIDFSELAHSYLKKPQSPQDFALKKMNFSWDDGGAYALLGPSGCGKSTLLNIISGLLRPSEGKVLYDGKDVTKLNPAQRNIAQVFQFPVIYDTMTVRENLAFPLINRAVPEELIANKVAEISSMLELDAVLDRRAAGLTADQKQKISMGRGLVRDDVAAILFDEPLTVIDPHLKWQLRGKLKEIHSRLRHTLVYVTHDQNEALTFADQVVVMYEGEVVQLGTPQELFQAPAHRFVGYFIGSPGMNFMTCHPSEGGLGIDGTGKVLHGPWGLQSQTLKGAKLELGIRPEFVEIGHPHDTASLPAKITSVDDLGNFRLATAQVGPHQIKAKLREGTEIPSGDCHLLFPPEWLRLYADQRLVA